MVAFDIGETLLNDTRYWAGWAHWLQVPAHTVSALVGAVVAQGRDNADALRLIRPDLDIAAAHAAREAAGCGEELDESDLYGDVRPALTKLRLAGFRVVVAGNQSAKAGQLLRALDLPADVIATSGEWGTPKPSPSFFTRVIEAAGCAPDQVVHVGDHPHHDLYPARAAGLRTAHLRRGPWGRLWAEHPDVIAQADWRVDSLMALAHALTPPGFSPEVDRVLRDAGWTRERWTGYDVWIDYLAPRGFTVTDAAVDFLREFGGLDPVIPAQGAAPAHQPFELDPALCGGHEHRFVQWGRRIGRTLVPIGVVGPNRQCLGIDEHGEVYLVDEHLATYGRVPRAIEALVLERTPRRLDIG